jgi:hypothetical protein
MPYINKKDRELYDNEIDALVDKLVFVFSNEPTKIHGQRAGHLNYIVTVLLKRFYNELAKKLGVSVRYADHNEIIGMLDCCKQEFYRRYTAPYEDEKIKSEGDVS